MKRKNYYPIFMIFILLSSCIQENDTLVNPPLIVETVNIRYFNLHNDEMQRTLILDNKEIAVNTAFNTFSIPDTPPYDSVTLQVTKTGSNICYKSFQKFKFARQSNYVMIALPDYRQKPDSVIDYEDTVIYIQTTILKPEDTNQCFVKFLNANPDTNYNYSIKIGCPNGADLFIDNAVTNVSYLQNTGIQAVYEGKRVVSIIKNNKNADSNSIKNEVIGIFELDLIRHGQYAMIVNKNDEVFFVNELDANSPINKLNNVEARNAYIRVINLSTDNITINSSAQGNITSNLNANFIDNYKNITTCDALSLDKLTLEVNGNINDSIYMSFDIYKKYSILAFDNKNKTAGKVIGIPSIDDRMKLKSDKAIVRVVNGNISDNGITISIGAREIANDIGYESGTTIAVNLLEGEFSKEIYINGGNLPISVFSSTQPTKYMFSSVVNLENGKEYLITINGLNDGTISAIEINDEMLPIQSGNNASFLQFVNVCNGSNEINFSISNIISNGKLSKLNSLTTFVPIGNNSLQATGNNFNFDATIKERTLLVATSTYDNPVLFAIQSPNMGANNDCFKYRFINATDDAAELQVKEVINDTTFKDLISNITAKTASKIISYARDKEYSFRIINQETGDVLYTTNNLLMTINKNYSIVFYGNKSIGYGILMLQEY